MRIFILLLAPATLAWHSDANAESPSQAQWPKVAPVEERPSTGTKTPSRLTEYVQDRILDRQERRKVILNGSAYGHLSLTSFPSLSNTQDIELSGLALLNVAIGFYTPTAFSIEVPLTFSGEHFSAGILLGYKHWFVNKVWYGLHLGYLAHQSILTYNFDGALDSKGLGLSGHLGYELISKRAFSLDLSGRIQVLFDFENSNEVVMMGSLGFGVSFNL